MKLEIGIEIVKCYIYTLNGQRIRGDTSFKMENKIVKFVWPNIKTDQVPKNWCAVNVIGHKRAKEANTTSEGMQLQR